MEPGWGEPNTLIQLGPYLQVTRCFQTSADLELIFLALLCFTYIVWPHPEKTEVIGEGFAAEEGGRRS